jgi:hypothetical protein
MGGIGRDAAPELCDPVRQSLCVAFGERDVFSERFAQDERGEASEAVFDGPRPVDRHLLVAVEPVKVIGEVSRLEAVYKTHACCCHVLFLLLVGSVWPSGMWLKDEGQCCAAANLMAVSAFWSAARGLRQDDPWAC